MRWWLNERSRNGGVDEVPLPLPASAGRLWLCGKHFVGPDADEALARTSAGVIVCLNEPHELAPRYPEYLAWLKTNAGSRAIWFPIADLHVPSLESVTVLIAQLYERLLAGEGLLVHCGAGVGRAGTIAAALLIRLGLSEADARATVARCRPSAGPQTVEQERLLAALSAL